MTNIIVSLVILLLIAVAIYKLVSDKRKGKTCTGCADSGKCSSTKPSNPANLGKKIAIKQVV